MNWHSLSRKEVVEKLGSGEKGLSSEEASKRIQKYGRNKLEKKNRFNLIKIFFEQFKSFLILILVFAAVISYFMESQVDAIVIFIIIFLNAGFGFFQEFRTEKAIEALNNMMVPEAKVFRNGKLEKIPSEELVPGDILMLEEGDKIMADARILECNSLKVNEASLTGESVSDEKSVKVLNENVPLVERENMVYQGTEVVFGNAKAIVVDIGMNTEIGKISGLVQDVQPEKNPFKDKLDRFAKKVGLVILMISVVIVTLLYFEGVEFIESLLVAVSLAVSAIPEGLPAVISLALALATRRMLKQNVLIRKLPASETLGRTTVICTDKTGTLTAEKMEVTDFYFNRQPNYQKNVEFLFKIGVLCNKAKYQEDSKEEFMGDPTEIALLISGKKYSLDKNKLDKEESLVKEFPFSSERKMMSVVRKMDKKIFSYVKGAPEQILKHCNYEFVDGKVVKLSDKDRIRLDKAYQDFSKKGLRVLGFAFKEVDGDLKQDFVEKDLVFVGFQGMIDPPRPEVKNAIKLCNQAGIKVIMITGDGQLTAEAVAKQIGLEGESISAEDLEKMSDFDLFKRMPKIGIFSRVSPQSKLRIINILKKRGEIVAMTGDGVNDALALKRADIGIAMGIRGTDVARSSAEAVLIDDNFASIVSGVREGRIVYDNVKKFVKYLLAANFSEVVLVLVVMLIWQDPLFLPLLPLQILWINLVTDSMPALALSEEPAEGDVMKRKPSKKGILNGTVGFIVFAGFINFLIDFWFFYINLDDLAVARTMVVTATVVFEMFLVFNCKSNGPVIKSGFNKYLLYAVIFSIGLHCMVLYSPLGSYFEFVRIDIFNWLSVIGVCFAGFLLMEGYKFVHNFRVK